ncbi:uncharacterized protein LOC115879891 isoform X1 [Sitophilus oryzae]|uniref:Uncharacterized protein LOC115879891 isoform X1 n=1 Tax=Sitophilus oryzae TaxID=7048 RepID=A0A6J2XN48_SITOR|nr:uncharacterized protein LOC115879891 isoform X1 [Sitophilus oryzae]
MDNPGEIMRFCRLCLVKDQVNIPIFEEQGDIRQIFLKISSCLPVKVSREDKLPKKICDGCSNKLDLLYEFWNTSANAEKTLLSWLGQAGVKDVDQTITAVAQQIAKPSEPQVKEETPEDGHAAVQNTDHLGISNSAVLDDSSAKDETEEPPPKRARRTAAVKAQINLTPDSEEEDDDLDTAEPMTKIEDESDESDNDDKDPSYVDVPGTSADDQPGPSGVGKDGAEAPSSLYCNKCGVGFQDFESLHYHIFNPIYRNHNFRCPLCNYVVGKTIADLNDHIIKRCQEEDVVKHEKSAVEELPKIPERYFCEKCGKPFSLFIDLLTHRSTHKRDLISCTQCPEKGNSFEYMIKHFRRHTAYPNISLICDMCSVKFTKVCVYVNHCEFVHKRFQSFRFQCNFCPRVIFNDSERFLEHVQSHCKISPKLQNGRFVCEFCGFCFGSRGKYIKHREKVHLFSKIIKNHFECHCCGKKIAHRKMSSHLRQHEKENLQRKHNELAQKTDQSEHIVDNNITSTSNLTDLKTVRENETTYVEPIVSEPDQSGNTKPIINVEYGNIANAQDIQKSEDPKSKVSNVRNKDETKSVIAVESGTNKDLCRDFVLYTEKNENQHNIMPSGDNIMPSVATIDLTTEPMSENNPGESQKNVNVCIDLTSDSNITNVDLSTSKLTVTINNDHSKDNIQNKINLKPFTVIPSDKLLSNITDSNISEKNVKVGELDILKKDKQSTENKVANKIMTPASRETPKQDTTNYCNNKKMKSISKPKMNILPVTCDSTTHNQGEFLQQPSYQSPPISVLSNAVVPSEIQSFDPSHLNPYNDQFKGNLNSYGSNASMDTSYQQYYQNIYDNQNIQAWQSIVSAQLVNQQTFVPLTPIMAPQPVVPPFIASQLPSQYPVRETNYKCAGCKKEVPSLPLLEVHFLFCYKMELEVLKDPREDCPVCGIRFPSFSNLKNHISQGHYELLSEYNLIFRRSDYICDTCGLLFYSMQTLEEHHQSHITPEKITTDFNDGKLDKPDKTRSIDSNKTLKTQHSLGPKHQQSHRAPETRTTDFNDGKLDKPDETRNIDSKKTLKIQHSFVSKHQQSHRAPETRTTDFNDGKLYKLDETRNIDSKKTLKIQHSFVSKHQQSHRAPEKRTTDFNDGKLDKPDETRNIELNKTLKTQHFQSKHQQSHRTGKRTSAFIDGNLVVTTPNIPDEIPNMDSKKTLKTQHSFASKHQQSHRTEKRASAFIGGNLDETSNIPYETPNTDSKNTLKTQHSFGSKHQQSHRAHEKRTTDFNDGKLNNPYETRSIDSYKTLKTQHSFGSKHQQSHIAPETRTTNFNDGKLDKLDETRNIDSKKTLKTQHSFVSKHQQSHRAPEKRTTDFNDGKLDKSDETCNIESNKTLKTQDCFQSKHQQSHRTEKRTSAFIGGNLDETPNIPDETSNIDSNKTLKTQHSLMTYKKEIKFSILKRPSKQILGLYRCEQCKKIFNNYKELISHKISHGDSIKEETYLSLSDPASIDLNLLPATNMEFVRNENMSGGSTRKRKLSNSDFDVSQHYNRRSCDENQTRRVCQICDQDFNTQSSFDQHSCPGPF